MARLPVQIKFTVLDQATKNIEGIGRSFRKASKDIDAVNSAAGKASTRMEILGKKMGAIGGAAAIVGASMTAALTLPIIGAAKSIVDGGIKFQDAQQKMKAATQATAEEMEQLKIRAMEIGAGGRIGATAATEAMTALGKAGFSANETINSIKSTMALAQIEGMGMAESAEFLADTLTIFKRPTTEAAQVVDMLVQASGKSSISLVNLQNSMKYVALGASELGLSVGDTAAAIGALGKLGIKGEMGGTTLRNFLTKLTSKESSIEALKAAGIKASDVFAMGEDGKLSQTTLRPYHEILESLKAANLTMAQTTKIFGAEFGMSTKRMISGAEEFRKFSEIVGQSTGATEERMKELNKGVAAALENLAAKWENLSIKLTQSGALDGIEAIIRRIGDLLDWFGNLDPAVQNTILTIAGFAAVLGPLLATFGLLAISIAQLAPVLGMLGGAFTALGGFITGGLAAFLPWTAAVAAIGALAYDLITNWSEFKDFMVHLFDNPMKSWEKVFYWLETRLGWLRNILGTVVPGLGALKFDAKGYEDSQWDKIPKDAQKNQPITPFANPDQWMKEFNRRQESKVVVDFKNVPKGLEVTTTQVAGSDVPLPIGRTKNVAGRNMRTEVGGRGR